MRPRIRRNLALLTAVLALAGCGGCAALDRDAVGSILEAAEQLSGPDEATVADGLREALRVGTARTVETTSGIDGFLADELIRVAIPPRLEKMADTLRKIGLDRQVDELEVAMNRAAEKAAGEATDIFVDAIGQITFADAMGILRGSDSAATDYFRQRTSENLRSRFRPIVTSKMDEVGLARQYDKLAGKYDALPFVTRPAVDLDAYITEEALDGLFTVLQREEKKIRDDPAARTTELLRRVFGSF